MTDRRGRAEWQVLGDPETQVHLSYMALSNQGTEYGTVELN